MRVAAAMGRRAPKLRRIHRQVVARKVNRNTENIAEATKNRPQLIARTRSFTWSQLRASGRSIQKKMAAVIARPATRLSQGLLLPQMRLKRSWWRVWIERISGSGSRVTG